MSRRVQKHVHRAAETVGIGTIYDHLIRQTHGGVLGPHVAQDVRIAYLFLHVRAHDTPVAFQNVLLVLGDGMHLLAHREVTLVEIDTVNVFHTDDCARNLRSD